MELKTITERIQYLISKSSYSKTEIAERAGMSKQALYKYEKGLITNIPSDKIEALALALNSSPAFLMGWDEERINEIEEQQKEISKVEDAVHTELEPLLYMGLTPDEAKLVTDYAKFLVSQRKKNNE